MKCRLLIKLSAYGFGGFCVLVCDLESRPLRSMLKTPVIVGYLHNFQFSPHKGSSVPLMPMVHSRHTVNTLSQYRHCDKSKNNIPYSSSRAKDTSHCTVSSSVPINEVLFL